MWETWEGEGAIGQNEFPPKPSDVIHQHIKNLGLKLRNPLVSHVIYVCNSITGIVIVKKRSVSKLTTLQHDDLHIKTIVQQNKRHFHQPIKLQEQIEHIV